MDAALLSAEATLARFDRAQDRVARDMGWGDTIGALGIAKDALGPLTAYIREQLERAKDLRKIGRPQEHGKFLAALKDLAPEKIALATLNGCLHSIAQGETLTETAATVGNTIHSECWAAGLLDHNEALAVKIERAVKRRHGSLKYRKQAARSIAARAGYKAERWSGQKTLIAGRTLVEYVLDALPETFVKEAENPEGENTKEWLTITPGALAKAEKAVEQALRGSPVFLPSTVPLKPWIGWNEGGYWDGRSRFRASVVRTRYKETAGEIKAAINNGTAQPFLDAINALQAVPWTINHRVLGIIQWAYQNDIPVPGLPPITDLPMPEKPDMADKAAKKLWKVKAAKVKQRNRTFMSQRILTKMDFETAELMAQHERFWTPMNTDWRGRVYALTSFNFQRDDRVRALFLFADGQPIGEEGLYWLKVHVANCGDFDKVSKRSFDERVKWTEDNLSLIEQIACVPTKELWWTKADKPFLFLAACLELTSALAQGPTYISRLPVNFDGSCSGLQHLAAMTRDEETAKLVNLLPTKEPSDVYQTVANAVNVTVEADALSGVSIASAWLKHGITRKLVKRNVMTYSYSSKKFGMAQQLMEDLMRPLELEVLAGTIEAHPFGDDNGRAAAKYLAGIIYNTIEALVRLPAEAMHMLTKCARVLAHEGKPVSWTTPLGLPWINRYHLPSGGSIDVDLWLHDSKVRVRMDYQEGHKADIDKDRAANGISPNFVHACDAAHLMMVANASVSENITQLATVHDSFGCLASQAGRFRQIIREQFVKLYETNDVLLQVLAQAQHDLTVHNQQRLPTVPAFGELNLKEVLNAGYAFA